MAWIGAGTWREARKVGNGNVVGIMMMMIKRSRIVVMKIIVMMIRMKMRGKMVLSYRRSGHELRQFVLHRVKKSVLLETHTELKMGSLRGR